MTGLLRHGCIHIFFTNMILSKNFVWEQWEIVAAADFVEILQFLCARKTKCAYNLKGLYHTKSHFWAFNVIIMFIPHYEQPQSGFSINSNISEYSSKDLVSECQPVKTHENVQVFMRWCHTVRTAPFRKSLWCQNRILG